MIGFPFLYYWNMSLNVQMEEYLFILTKAVMAKKLRTNIFYMNLKEKTLSPFLGYTFWALWSWPNYVFFKLVDSQNYQN